MRYAQRMACWLGLALLAGCAQEDSGVDEPFRIRGAEFIEGALPGSEDAESSPRLTALLTANLNVHQGEGNHAFSGQAEPVATSVAIAVDGVGTGYWVVPTGVIDVATGEVTWTAHADFGITLRPGRYTIRAVAIAESGEAGRQLTQPLCVAGRVPDNGRACDDTRQPPRAVVSLQWDSNVDLDLVLVAEDGTQLSPKSLLAAEGTAAQGGKVDRDSNPACMIDGIRTENAVWNEITPTGRYRVYANLFDACQQPSVNFVLSVYTAAPRDDGTADVLERKLRRTGQLLQMSADPRASSGLFITDLNFGGGED